MLTYTVVFAIFVGVALTFGLYLRARKTPLLGRDYSFVEENQVRSYAPGLISVPQKGAELSKVNDMVPSAKSPELGRLAGFTSLDADIEQHVAPSTCEARAVQGLLQEMDVTCHPPSPAAPAPTIVQFLDVGVVRSEEEDLPGLYQMSSCATLDTDFPEHTYDEDNGGLGRMAPTPLIMAH